MFKAAILTVIYHENENHFKMALRTWASMPSEIPIYAVINRKLEGVEYPENITYIENDENCLSRAWNIGLTEIFKKYDHAFVSGLDSESPTLAQLQLMSETLERHNCGIVAAVAQMTVDNIPYIRHGDGSFSFFVISKKTFNELKYTNLKGELKTGFNEDFKPAYFEDNDYLERLWKAGYKPLRLNDVSYFHVFQGTIKGGGEINTQYPIFMQRNLELFKKLYGKVPDHLPEDIKFIQ